MKNYSVSQLGSLELLHQQSDSCSKPGTDGKFPVFDESRLVDVPWVYCFEGHIPRVSTKLVSFGGPEGQAPAPSLIPMNGPVRAALQKVIDNRTTGNVFDYKQTGVSASTLRQAQTKPVGNAGCNAQAL